MLGLHQGDQGMTNPPQTDAGRRRRFWNGFWGYFWRCCVLSVVVMATTDLTGGDIVQAFKIMQLITSFGAVAAGLLNLKFQIVGMQP